MLCHSSGTAFHISHRMTFHPLPLSVITWKHIPSTNLPTTDCRGLSATAIRQFSMAYILSLLCRVSNTFGGPKASYGLLWPISARFLLPLFGVGKMSVSFGWWLKPWNSLGVTSNVYGLQWRYLIQKLLSSVCLSSVKCKAVSQFATMTPLYMSLWLNLYFTIHNKWGKLDMCALARINQFRLLMW